MFINERIAYRLFIAYATTTVFVVISLVACSNENRDDADKIAPLDLREFVRAELSLLVENGDVDGIRQLLARSPQALDRSVSRHDVVFEAVNSGNTEIIEVLAEFGAVLDKDLGVVQYSSPNIPTIDRRGFTPLHQAAQKGDLRMVAKLLELGVNPEARFRGVLAEELALSKGYQEVANIIRKVRLAAEGD